MAETERRYILGSDGRISRETITREPITVADDIIARCHPEVNHTLRNVFPVNGAGPASAIVTAQGAWWTIPISKITLRCPFQVDKEQVMVPAFEKAENPVMSLDWSPPSSARLRLLCYVANSERRSDDGQVWFEYAYLYMYSENGNAWRLPLPNIYDDCRICDGQKRVPTPTIAQQTQILLDEFTRSRWNTDLWGDPDKTFGLFRWKPNKESFEQLEPTNRNWTVFCQKVATEVMKYVVL